MGLEASRQMLQVRRGTLRIHERRIGWLPMERLDEA